MDDSNAKLMAGSSARGVVFLIAILGWVLSGKALCGESSTRITTRDHRVSVTFPGENIWEQLFAVEPKGTVEVLSFPSPGNDTPNAGISAEAIKVDRHLLNVRGVAYGSLEFERPRRQGTETPSGKDEPLMVYLVRASSEELAARAQRVGSNGWRFSTEQSGELADVVVHDIGTKRYAFYVVFPPEASQRKGDRFLNSITLR